MKPIPSEVWGFVSPTRPRDESKFKYHLCIATEGLFLFVSTHKIWDGEHPDREFMIIDNEEVPFLKRTETGKSEISCTTVIVRRFPDSSVPKRNPRGAVKRKIMKKLFDHVRRSRYLTEDERDAILENLYDYYGSDLH